MILGLILIQTVWYSDGIPENRNRTQKKHGKLPKCSVNSLLASSAFYGLLKTFVNILDPEQDRQKVWYSDSFPEQIFLKKKFWKKIAANNKSIRITQHALR